MAFARVGSASWNARPLARTPSSHRSTSAIRAGYNSAPYSRARFVAWQALHLVSLRWHPTGCAGGILKPLGTILTHPGHRRGDQPGAQYAALKPIYLSDDLVVRQPAREAVRAVDSHFPFVCKPETHPAIEELGAGIVLDERVERIRRGKQTATHRYRGLCDVPLRGDAKAMSVNWLEIEITEAKGNITYRNSFISDLPVHRDIVAELAACGRARWKIENETLSVLKTKDYNLEHNFGHGKQYLAAEPVGVRF